MLLSIQDNISDSFAKYITISFANLFTDADYVSVSGLPLVILGIHL